MRLHPLALSKLYTISSLPPRPNQPLTGLAGRYYQLLSGHAATGDYLCNKVHKLPSDRCWWCGQDVRQTRHHLFVNCAAWKPQIKELWKGVGYLCGWRNPRAPRMALLFGDERATRAVLSFLRKMEMGQMVTIPPRDEAEEEGEEGEEGERGKAEGEEGEAGAPLGFFARERPGKGRIQDGMWRARGGCFFCPPVLLSPPRSASSFLFRWGLWEEGDRGALP